MGSRRSNRSIDNGWDEQVFYLLGNHFFILQGGYMNAKKQKLTNQFAESDCNHKSNIFSGIRVHVNGYTGRIWSFLAICLKIHPFRIFDVLFKSMGVYLYSITLNLPETS